MTLLTWNVAGRVRDVPAQARALAERPVDVVLLQEVRASSWSDAASPGATAGSTRAADRPVASRPMGTAHLYGLKHSHAVLTSRMGLEATGLPFRQHDLFPGFHGVVVRARGFPKWTVPALAIDNTRVQGTLAIARELHRRAPEAGLFPEDPDAREAVEAAERFGHDELQAIARRVFQWTGRRDNGVRAWMAREVIGFPAPTATAAGYAMKPVMTFFSRVISQTDDARLRADLAGLPERLDRADAFVADGTIGGDRPNAGDLQVFPCLRLLMAHADLRPIIEPRPCGRAALALLPDYPRSGPEALPAVPAALPPAWLPGAAGPA